MKKTELMRAFYKIDSVDMHVWSCWVEWRRKQAGIDIKDKEWNKIMKSVPEYYDWTPYHKEGHVTFSWDGGEENVPLEEFVSDLDEQPKLTMLWHTGYYDGPLSGMAELDGELVWFDLEEEDDDRYRTFNLYRLTDEERQETERRHKTFQDQVGHHSDYGDVYRPFGVDERPGWCPPWMYDKWRRFQFWRFYRFSKNRKEVDFKSREPFMVADECQFDRRKTNV